MTVLQVTNVAASSASAGTRAPLTRESLAEFTGRLRALSEGTAVLFGGSPAVEAGSADLITALKERDAELRLADSWLHEQQEQLEQTRRLLELERARSRQLFENAPDPYVTTDAKGFIHDANARGAALLGMPVAALRGKLLISFVARGDTRKFRDRFRALRDPSTPRVLDVHIRPRGQRPFPVSMSSQAMHDVDGHSTGHNWIIRETSPGSDETSLHETLKRAVEALQGAQLAAAPRLAVLASELVTLLSGR
jgi:PAS domain S-box-containing protein